MKDLDALVELATSVGMDVFEGNERVPSDVDRARTTCAELLSKPLGLDDATVWTLLVTSASLVGDDDAAILVHELAEGTASAECPRCHRTSGLEVDGDKVWLEKVGEGTGDAGTRDPSVKLPPEVTRLAGLARTAGHPAIAHTLELLDSRVQCPFCKQWSPALETLDALR